VRESVTLYVSGGVSSEPDEKHRSARKNGNESGYELVTAAQVTSADEKKKLGRRAETA
jgi:hypothetical protein